MLRHNFAAAAREVRFHPSRVIATIIAIAISVGFMAAVSVFLQTQREVMGKQLALPSSSADLVVSLTPNETATEEDVLKTLPNTEGVAEFSAVHNQFLPLKSPSRKVQMSSAYNLPSENFRWASLREGQWPKDDTEIAISPSLADDLDTKVGDELTAGDMKLKLTGITDDKPSMFFKPAYLAPADYSFGNTLLVSVSEGSDPESVATQLNDRLKPFANESGNEDPLARTSEQYQEDALTGLSSDFDAMRNVLLVFAGIALLVGMIIIANTFTILLAQRRRQIGLLRAVGATSNQVRARYLTEALLLGFIGSALGIGLGVLIAIIGSQLTGTLAWGISVPWGEVCVELIVGVAITLIAAMVPVLRTSKVRPLEALRPVATHEAEKRKKRARAVVCGLFALAAIGLIVGSMTIESQALPLAIAGAMLLTIAVLAGSQLYIPALIRVLGVPLRGRPAGNLAVENTLRNPARASTTATALMLAIGLIVTLQVGTATAEKTMSKAIDENNPVDLSVSTGYMHNPQDGSLTGPKPLSESVQNELSTLPNVRSQTTLNGVAVNSGQYQHFIALGWNSKAVQTVHEAPEKIGDDVALMNDSHAEKEITLTGPSGSVTLKTEESKYPQRYDQVIISESNLAKLGESQPMSVWLKLDNRDDVAQTLDPIGTIVQASPDKLDVSGSAFQAMILQKVLDNILLVVTALLAVAVIIALIGVGNTLTLSVIERNRETALLRALGMQRSSVRLMLLIEALLLAFAAALVAVVFGMFFGWLGINSLLTQIQHETNQTMSSSFAIDLPQTLVMLAITLLAAGLASILPGRRAVQASPTQALAEE